MRLKLISCDIFEREAKAAAARSSNHIEFEFLPQPPHQVSDQAKVACAQALIDRADRSRFHAVLLVAGSCKDGLAGLRAGSIPLVLPRAKDCISLVMQRPKPARQRPMHQVQSSAVFAGNRPFVRMPDGLQSRSMAPVLQKEEPHVSLISGYGWKCRERFGNPGPGHSPNSSGPRQTCSVLEMLVNGYWNYTDFLVVAPRWRVVINGEGVIAAEECTP